MGKKAERVVIQVDEELKKTLTEQSELTGVPISEFIRRSIKIALGEKQ